MVFWGWTWVSPTYCLTAAALANYSMSRLCMHTCMYTVCMHMCKAQVHNIHRYTLRSSGDKETSRPKFLLLEFFMHPANVLCWWSLDWYKYRIKIKSDRCFLPIKIQTTTCIACLLFMSMFTSFSHKVTDAVPVSSAITTFCFNESCEVLDNNIPLLLKTYFLSSIYTGPVITSTRHYLGGWRTSEVKT